MLEVLDGLVLTGGADVDPALYGAEPDPRTVSRPDRDRAELPLLRRALEADMPVLGVCRGMQLLAVAAGGTPAPAPARRRSATTAPPRARQSTASRRPGSCRAAGSPSLLGSDARIHCYHHQGVADPGTLLVTGRAEDGLPEAVEDPDRRFVLGVQWHPEVVRDGRLFGALVEAAHEATLSATA